MRRVHVVGTSGSGKSTVARALAERMRVPHIELDALHWLPGWTERAVPEFRALLADRLACEGWVVDGNYGSRARDLVWARADTVVWLDLPRSTVMKQVLTRTVRRWWRREVLWSGNREQLRKVLSRDSILLWAWTTWPTNRAEYAAVLADVPFPMVHLRSRAEVDAWLASVARGGLEG